MKKFIKGMIVVSFIFYLFGLFVILFLGGRGFAYSDLSLIEYIKYSTNIVPFRTIGTYLRAIADGSMNLDIPLKNLGGNLVLFVPIGFFLPFIKKNANKIGNFLVYILLLLLSIEVVQVLSKRGSFDIDDLILNIVGALVGYSIWRMKFVQTFVSHISKRQSPSSL